MEFDFEELERSSAALQHNIWDANEFDDPFWYRESLNTGYDFRLGPRDPDLPQPSCRIDQDESGDFDPFAKQILPPTPLKRKREAAPPELDDNGEPVPRKPRQATWQFGRFNGLSRIVTLKLNSSAGLHLLASGIDNWPADDEPESSGSSHGQDSIFSSLSDGTLSNTTNHEDYPEPYVFRPRDKACHYNEDRQPGIDSDIDLSKITLGHPAARGQPCRTCSNINVKCIAGPANGRTRNGPSLDQANPTKFLKQSLSRISLGRRFVNCTQCRQAKKWCSLRAGQDGPCNRCKSADTACTFESLRSALKKKGIIQSEPLPLHPSVKDLKDNSKPRADTFANPFTSIIAQPTIKTITTRLAHPISFNYTPSDDTPPCHWCADPLYGLLGLGTVSVQVHALTTMTGKESNAGYTELQGGHTDHGHLPSRMCTACTFERFGILASIK
ncbi:MAG: hypothetical protein Q9168_007742 [Polycauliona sp. 1 TL-2023]